MENDKLSNPPDIVQDEYPDDFGSRDRKLHGPVYLINTGRMTRAVISSCRRTTAGCFRKTPGESVCHPIYPILPACCLRCSIQEKKYLSAAGTGGGLQKGNLSGRSGRPAWFIDNVGTQAAPAQPIRPAPSRFPDSEEDWCVTETNRSAINVFYL